MSAILNYTWTHLLSSQKFRNAYCFSRSLFFLKILRRPIRVFSGDTDAVSENAIFSNRRIIQKNQSKHPHPTAKYLFGIGANQACFKSNFLINPLKAIPRISTAQKELKVLSIGPRAEGEIFNLVAHGFKKENIKGLDLFSYSPLIDVGDMHKMPYDDNSFDIVLMGWCIAYSNDKKKAASEVLRVMKNSGVVSIGVSYSPLSNDEIVSKRGYLIGSEKRLENTSQILDLFKGNVGQVYFKHDISEADAQRSGKILCTFELIKPN